MFGGDLLKPNLASLLTTSFPNVLECAQFFWSVGEDVQCNTCHIITSMSNVSRVGGVIVD